jgi:hypothetical protein
MVCPDTASFKDKRIARGEWVLRAPAFARLELAALRGRQRPLGAGAFDLIDLPLYGKKFLFIFDQVARGLAAEEARDGT